MVVLVTIHATNGIHNLRADCGFRDGATGKAAFLPALPPAPLVKIHASMGFPQCPFETSHKGGPNRLIREGIAISSTAF